MTKDPLIHPANKQSAMMVFWLFLAMAVVAIFSIDFSPPEPGVSSPRSGPALTFDGLLDAIEWVESKGYPLAVGDDGNAVGAYQIHKIYVDDVNRILQLSGVATRVNYNDRLDAKLSRGMVGVYLAYYAGPQEVVGSMEALEICARIHKGGPSGHKKKSTKKYWLKVKARMESVK